MTGDISASLTFLRTWKTEGPWVLSAIHPRGEGIDTQTFFPATEAKATEYLQKYMGVRNIYFHVNSVMKPLTKKAEVRDIRSMDWLHIDIDPRKDQPLVQERLRIAALMDKMPEGVPDPTVVIDSGGGYQAFWRLREPLEINGNMEAAEEAKRYNQQLESLLGADACHNLDRIMRLPGTINVPTPKKERQGRTEKALAVLIRFSDKSYDLTDFIQAPIVQTRALGSGFSAPGRLVQVSGNIKRLGQIDELDQWNVPYRVKVIVMEGRNEEEGVKDRDDSRSAWLFDGVCGLVRAGVPDEIIYSVITDPDFKISECVLDKGSNSEKYAIKQIEDARLKAINPQLLELNQRHAVIANMGGKCRVIEEVMDHVLNRTRVTKQTFDDFRNRYMNKHVDVGTDTNGRPIRVPLGKWWLQHEHRREFNTIVFAPNKDVRDSYNLWKGFAYPARPGDCSAFLEHIRVNLCKGNELHYEYMVGWMARAVKDPDTPGQVAIVLKGPQGVGKSFFAKTFGALWGRHFLPISDPKHLVGSFNAHLRDCVILFADEAFYAGDKKHESILKTLITEETIMIEGKGVDAEASPNYIHLIMASNSHWVVPAGAGERRYFVIDVGEDQMQNSEYFKVIIRQMENGGYEALLHYLMTYDLSHFDVRAVPKTKALQDQKLFSLSTEEEWWFNRLCEGKTLERTDEWLTEVSKNDLYGDYIEYSRRMNIMRRATPTALGKFLQRVCPGTYPRSYQKLAEVEESAGDGYMRRVRRRLYFYAFPPLEACRDTWDNSYGGSTDWPGEETQLPL